MLLADPLDQFIAMTSPEHNERQEEMVRRAEDRDFPTIGRAAGGVLMTLARLSGATRVFEFGSGFGYSASWFLRGMAAGSSIVLTEIDTVDHELAQAYLGAESDTYQITFERGDALSIIDRYDGPFDIVLLDHEKERYIDAFERVVGKMAPNGIIVADNVLDGPVWYEDLLPYLDDGEPADPQATKLLEYIRTVTTHPGVETSILPVDEGLAISVIDPEQF